MAKHLDSLGILRRLVNGGVDFVLIGGSAAIAHGSAVTTEDVDICASLDEENARRIVRAFADANPRWRMRPDLPVITPDDLRPGLKNMYLRTDLGQLDVLGEVPQVCSFDELKGTAVEMEFGDIKCRVIDIDTLIRAKGAAGRQRDLRAIQDLEVIKQKRQKP